MNFTNKETYLAYRADWKAQYRQLSSDIRKSKQELKKAQREGDATTRYFNVCINGKMRARDMLAELHESKQKAQRLWVKEHQAA